MRTTKFFRMVWRANALVIMAVGLTALAVLIFFFVQFRTDYRRSDSGARAIDSEAAGTPDAAAERLSLGSAERIRGTPYTLIALQSERHDGRAYSSRPDRLVRNYGFIDLEGRVRWLYPHNRFLVTSADELADAENGRQAGPVQAMLFVVRQADTDGDKRLTVEDNSVLAFSRPDGGGYREVLGDVDQIVSKTVVGNELLIVYQSVSGPVVARVSLQDFSVKSKKPLALPDGKAADKPS